MSPEDRSPREGDLQARIAALEAERWRTFEDAQREADRVFAQYQLSQLLASGDTLATMAAAVLEELVRHNGAARAALWLATPGREAVELVATVVDPGAVSPEMPAEGRPVGPAAEREPDKRQHGEYVGPAHALADPAYPPATFASSTAAAAWSERNGWSGVALAESRDLGELGVEQRAVGFVALAPAPGGVLEPDHERFLALIRHELAIAFRAAQLREILARERTVLSAILDGASEAIVAVDADRRVVRANVAALGLLGPSNAVDGSPCHEALRCLRDEGSVEGDASRRQGRPLGEGRPGRKLRCGDRCPFEEVLSSTTPVVYRERSLATAQGDVPVGGSYARMPGPDAGAVGVLRDLRTARALDELKASFVAAVSHELRTPLALIAGYTESLLHLELAPARQREYVEKIGHASERLALLVDQILEISRLESDRLSLERRPVALADLVASLVADLAETPNPPLVSTAILGGIPLLDVDPSRVGQVLRNLVTNAAKYAGPDAAIRLAARRDGDFALVSVQDDGPGIDPEEREHVFERFYRGRRVRSSSQPGSGLGLYLCRRLVEAHGGRIWLEDTPPDRPGTSISLTLPLVPERLRAQTGS